MENVTLLVALGAGSVSFISPCVLPIVPGFLTLITGLDVTSDEARRGKMLRIVRECSCQSGTASIGGPWRATSAAGRGADCRRPSGRGGCR